MKPLLVHGSVGNAPYGVSIAATAPPSSPRTFVGTGAPSAATLNSGNSKFNGLNSGFVTSVSLDTFGSGVTVGTVITFSGGTGTAVQITADAVDISGKVVDYHVSRIGNYSAYPSNYEPTVGISGVQGYINLPPPDYYIDATTLTAPVLYVCTSGGTESTSVWAKVSGGSAGASQQFKIVSDGGDYWICNMWNGSGYGIVNVNVVKDADLRCGSNAIGAKIIRGVTYTYTYTPVYQSGSSGPVAYYTRAVSGSDGSSEIDYTIPDPTYISSGTTWTGAVIIAAPCGIICPGIPGTVQSATIASGGSGYLLGDVGKVLTIVGGTGPAATLTINNVGGGQVTGVILTTGGNYTTNPTLTGAAVTGSTSGSGATFNLTMAPPFIDLSPRIWSK